MLNAINLPCGEVLLFWHEMACACGIEQQAALGSAIMKARKREMFSTDVQRKET
jgi:hypothetical protein